MRVYVVLRVLWMMVQAAGLMVVALTLLPLFYLVPSLGLGGAAYLERLRNQLDDLEREYDAWEKRRTLDKR